MPINETGHLVLHNVADEELYVGVDGITRPYAVVYPGNEHASLRSKKLYDKETGSFGRSVRRSRSRSTAAPLAKREDPNIQAADAIFSSFVSELTQKASSNTQQTSTSGAVQRNVSNSSNRGLPSSMTMPNLSSGAQHSASDEESPPPRPAAPKIPTEVILRGFQTDAQYAAISHYERLAGRICEDYARDPPIQSRRFKSDLRDATALRRRALTAEERIKAMRFAGGENWVKVTYESKDAAEAAVENSPQVVLGFLVYAELYRGAPPTDTDPQPVPIGYVAGRRLSNNRERSTIGVASGLGLGHKRGSSMSGARDRTFGTVNGRPLVPSYSRETSTTDSMAITDIAEERSARSSSTATDATLLANGNSESSATASGSSSTLAGPTNGTIPVARRLAPQDAQFCERIPTAKRVALKPYSEALLPQQSVAQKALKRMPVIGWLTTDMIGSTVPRTEVGEFDWAKASLYWKVMWFFDLVFRLFGGDLVEKKDD